MQTSFSRLANDISMSLASPGSVGRSPYRPVLTRTSASWYMLWRQASSSNFPGFPAAPRVRDMTRKKNTLKMSPPSARKLPVTLASPSEPSSRNLHPRLLDAATGSTVEMEGAEESLSPMVLELCVCYSGKDTS